MPMDPTPTARAATDLEELLVSNASQMTETINTALTRMEEYLQAGADFAVEQAPFLVQEALTYRLLETGLYLLFSLVFIGWAAYAWRFSYRNAEARVEKIRLNAEALYDHPKSCSETIDVAFSFIHYGVPISGCFSVFVGICIFFHNLMPFLKLLVAPRLYLIEYFRNLL